MKNSYFPRFGLVLALLTSLLIMESGCSKFPFFQTRPTPSKSTQAEQYVLAQAMADITLQKQKSGGKLPASYVNNLNVYAPDKKSKKNALTIPVLAMEYELKENGEQKTLVIPVPITASSPSFHALRQVQKPLVSVPHTLQDLRTYYVTVTLPAPQKFSNDSDVLRQQLSDARQDMLDNAAPLMPYDNARLQLQLVEFFMHVRMRDAAYLALENAKDTLVSLVENEPQENVAALSQKADALASRLNKEMPYKL